MRLKTNLHFHSSDDPRHQRSIYYDTKKGIDHAASVGIEALALTFHHTFAWTPELAEYASKKGVLLIPGVELYIKEERKKGVARHVIALNCTKEIEKVLTFKELEIYKKEHPKVFVIAPHPYFYGHINLKELLEKYIHVFDAIEHSWYYSTLFNRNKSGQRIAEKYNLPFIATSDTHHLKYLGSDYALVDVKEKSAVALFDAIKQKQFKNITHPKNFFIDMFLTQGKFFAIDHHYHGIFRKDYHPRKINP